MNNNYTLRISVTNNCNLNCSYCNPKRKIDPTIVLSDKELLEIIEAASCAGIKKVSWTGGEPTVRPNFIDLVRKAQELGMKKQNMTSNGLIYHRIADKLKEAGLTGVNFSLDTLDPEEFKKICGFDRLHDVIKSIEKATKFNSVLTQSNRHVFSDLVNFTEKFNGKLIARFLEVVPCGQNYEENPRIFDKEFVPVYELLYKFAQLGKLIPLENTGDVRGTFYFKVEDMNGIYGLNPNYSKNYKCDEEDCRKVRLNPEGFISNCTIQLKYARQLKGKTLAQKKKILKEVVKEKMTRDYTSFKHKQKHYDFWRFGIMSEATKAALNAKKQ